MRRVVILGGGFGGLAAATDLREVLDPADEIVLVSRDHRFAMGWTKIWDLVGIRPLAEGARELGVLRERGIRVVHAEIDRIDPRERGVATSDGDIEGDGMIVALGAGNHPGQVAQLDGVAAHDLYDFAALPAARAALAATTEGHILVAVMGQPFKCPPAPFEAILAIDEHLRTRGDRDRMTLTIATPSPGALPVAGPAASQAIADQLAARDIELRTEHLVTAIAPGRPRVTFDTGAQLDADLLLAVPGAVPPPPVVASELAGPGGWIHPDPRTLATEFARVYAVGDCTTVPTATAALPKAGVFAEGEGHVAARNLAADLGLADPVTFDGQGYCFFELPGREVAVVGGDFFAQPVPEVAMAAPSAEAYQRKVDFEAGRLAAWFGA